MIDTSGFESIKAPLEFFFEISKIPRGSGNSKGIADYLEAFANERGLFYVRDSLDNLIIRKPATKGYEDRPGIIFQGHTDMVAEKAENVNIDMQKEGLELYRDGDFLRARGTTLGGDDGVAIAYALSVLDSNDIPHPEFEAIFTSDEEVGLTGATGIDLSHVKGRLLINIDSTTEGEFTVGCAGGVRADITLPVKREERSGYAYRISLTGLFGGHSGGEINNGRLNAIRELITVLSLIDNAHLISLSGGNADNAIPRDAEAVVLLSAPLSENDKARLALEEERIRKAEAGAVLEISETTADCAPLDRASSDNIISLVLSEPNGVIAMCEDRPKLVETSLNIGIIRLDTDSAHLAISLRSSVGKKKAELADRVADIAKSHGASIGWRGDYPAWEYRKQSYLRDKMCQLYNDMYGKSPEIRLVHAGLECGILSAKLPELDCVSMGPENFDIHTPNEHLSLPSFARVWEYLKALLKNI